MRITLIDKFTIKYDVGHYTGGDPNPGVGDVQAEKPEQERVNELYFSVYPRDHDHDHDCKNMFMLCTDFDLDHVKVMHKLKNRWWKERGAKNCKALRNAPKGASPLKARHQT